MDNLIVCPLPAYLADVPSNDCPTKFDQIQRILFTRLSSTPFTETDILLEATWTPRMIATDDEKIIGTPKISGMVLPVVEPIKNGGNDNSTIDGVPELVGLGFGAISLQIRNVSSAQAKALRALASESVGETNLGAYFVNRLGEIIYDLVGTNAQPFPVYNVAVGDIASEGFNANNVLPISFDLPPGWSQNFAMKKITAFNVLTIKNAA